ncbi:hypothetical protein C8J56DRAFT_1027865 [Mycena floridula]|nr:hypothetical protein C8J56DRAFT_1027865 [Mycena floridula]
MANRFVLVAYRGETIGRSVLTTGCHPAMPWTKNGNTPPFPVAVECPNPALAIVVHQSLQPLAQEWKELEDPSNEDLISLLSEDTAYANACRQMDRAKSRFYAVQRGQRCGVFVSRDAAIKSLESGGIYHDLRIFPTFHEAMLSIFTNGEYPTRGMENVDTMEEGEIRFAQIYSTTAPPAPVAPAPVASVPDSVLTMSAAFRDLHTGPDAGVLSAPSTPNRNGQRHLTDSEASPRLNGFPRHGVPVAHSPALLPNKSNSAPIGSRDISMFTTGQAEARYTLFILLQAHDDSRADFARGMRKHGMNTSHSEFLWDLCFMPPPEESHF